MERGLEDMSSILKVEDLVKYYGEGENQVRAVDHTSLQIERGKFTAIVGRSGSGKSTLLHLIGGLDRPDSGKVWIDGTDIYSRKDDKLAQFRRKKIGFIFQDFNLLDNFSIEDNIKLPLVLAGEDYKKMDAKVQKAAGQLGIVELLKKYPYEVSGGQKQRAAIARALITKPQLILADEPSGALDSKAADSLMNLFTTINQEGQTIVMVTHSVKAASSAKRVLFIKDGKVFHQLYRGNLTNEEMYERISDTLKILTTGGEEDE